MRGYAIAAQGGEQGLPLRALAVVSWGMQITVFGAGAWGTALAQVVSDQGHDTKLWTWLPEHARSLTEARENKQFLPGVPLHEGIIATSSMEHALSDCELAVIVVPSHAVRKTMRAAVPFLQDKTRIVCASKGIEQGSLALMTEVIADELSEGDQERELQRNRLAVLSGPSFAKEVARCVPTNLVAASWDEDFTVFLQETFSTQWLRVYTSTDPIGVEIGGALKNVIAVAAGACDGFSLGQNTRAALITRGIAEMGRLVNALGGDAITTSGLAGVGDLVLTCTGDLSRNRTLGYKLGKGVLLKDALSTSDGVAEGYVTAKSAHDLAKKVGVELPICEEVYSVLYEGKDPSLALKSLLSRPLRAEHE